MSHSHLHRVEACAWAELPMRGGPRGRSLASPLPAPPSALARSRRLQTPGRVSPCLGGARLGPGWGPSCPCGVAPSGARSPAPGLRRPRLARPASPPAPSRFVGGHAALARSGWLQTPGRISPRLGEAPQAGPPRAHARSAAPGLRHPCLARPRPRFLLVHTFGAPAPPRVKPWRAPQYCQAAYCDSDEGMRPVGHSQRASPGTAAPAERHLQVTRRPPLASRPGPVSTRRRTGARIRTPHGRLPARAWLRRRAELAPCPPPEALPPCALRADPTRLPHTICSGTMCACENGGPPPLPFSGGEERPPPLPKWEGRREASSSSPPVFGRGGASGALAGGPRPRLGLRLGTAHLRTGGEEECARTADTNPGCKYLVRGYNPSMHYFWRGDMQHFSPPLPFQRGRAECRRVLARDLGGPDRGRPRVPGCGSPPTPVAGASSTSAGLSGAPAGAGQWWSPNPRSRRAVDLGRPEWGASACRAAVVPDPRGRRAVDLGRPEQGAPTCQAAAVPRPLRRARRQPRLARHPCRRGPAGAARAAPVRRGMTAAISNWPAAPAAGQPKQARPPSPAALPHFHTTFDSAHNAILR